MAVTAKEAEEEHLLDPVILKTPGTTTRHQIEETKKNIRREKRLHARARTMNETAKEAAEFLKQTTGTKEFLAKVVRSHAPETRGRTKARKLLADILSHAAGEHGDESAAAMTEKAKRSSLHMTFHLFDHEGTGKVTEEQLASIFRSLGLRPIKRKIRAIMAELDPEKSGFITEEDFVDHMIHLHDQEATEPEAAASPAAGPAAAAAPAGAAGPAAAAAADSSAPAKSAPVPAGWGVEEEDAPSVFDYYGSAAGMSLSSASADASATGSMFNLGVDGAFGDFRLLVFVGTLPDAKHAEVEQLVSRLGIQVTVVSDLRNLVRGLPLADAVWIFSGPASASQAAAGKPWETVNEDAFVRLMRDYHYSGRGIAIFATGFPEAAEATALTYNFFGFKLDSAVEGSGHATVTSHQLMSGVSSLAAGGGQLAASAGVYGDLKFVAEDSNKSPAVLCKDFAHTFGVATPTGRIVVDTSASRFLTGDEDAKRYAANSAVWLLGLDYRIGNNYPTSGSLIEHDANMQHVWQYKHGGWYNYEPAASKIVEEKYQEYVQNPYKCDVREVQSGYWKYMVDFVNMIQTNAIHPAHTSRDIRRVPTTSGVE